MEEFNRWFDYCINNKTKEFTLVEDFKVRDSQVFSLIFEKWFSKVCQPLKGQFVPKIIDLPWLPIMYRCEYMGPPPKYKDRLYNGNHEYICRQYGRSIYQFYTTDIVIIEGRLYKWEVLSPTCRRYRPI